MNRWDDGELSTRVSAVDSFEDLAREFQHLLDLGLADAEVPIVAEKKTPNLAVAPVSTQFPFSKPVSDGLNRENAFEKAYRESRFRRISQTRRKVLAVLANHRLRAGF
jgi:hypothetical protein